MNGLSILLANSRRFALVSRCLLAIEVVASIAVLGPSNPDSEL